MFAKANRNFLLLLPALLIISEVCWSASPVVLQPSADLRVPAGDDFATQVLGDPWDFDSIHDTFSPNARDLANQQVTGGIYRFDTVDGDNTGSTKAQFWLIHPGLQNAQRLVSESRNPETGRRLFTREKFPIDPSRYRYLTTRVRYSSAGPSALTSRQSLVVYYFEDETSIGKAEYGGTMPLGIEPNEWITVSIDLATNVDPRWTESWSEMPQVEGLRIDPASQPGVHVEIDWIRLTAEPAPGERVSVTWQGNGAEDYAISARSLDIAGAEAVELLAGVAGTSADISLGKLPAGNYRLEITGQGETGLGTAQISVNDVPRVEVLSPSIKGDQERAYGVVATSNPWASIDAGDIEEVLGFDSFTFDNPVGTFYGRPTTSRGRLLMNTPVPIDTALYRMLCFESEILGEENIGLGSVTKILWGNKRSYLTTPSPVIAHEQMNEYCLGDMADVRIDPGSPVQAENAWIGAVDNIRFDPHEFARTSECDTQPDPEECRDVRFASMVLAPFHRADPAFTFTWSDSDGDDNAWIELYLDDDLIPGNTSVSEEFLLLEVDEDDPSDALEWMATGVPDGLWNVYVVTGDGLNSSTRYASGPLLIGQPDTATVVVTEPNGTGDQVKAGREYGLNDRLNQWDMDHSELDLERVKNVDSLSLSDGVFSGTTANNQSQFILMTSDAGDPDIITSIYRYLTMKVRVAGGDRTNFLQVFFSDSPEFNPTIYDYGNTPGIPLTDEDWKIVTIDLYQDTVGSGPNAWTDFPSVRSIRIDPTNAKGAFFEFDWVTLSAAPNTSTDFTVHWLAENTGASVFDIYLKDAHGDRFRLQSGMPAETRHYTFNMAHLVLGEYFIEVSANPGPTDLSSGPIELVETLVIPGLLFSDGFE